MVAIHSPGRDVRPWQWAGPRRHFPPSWMIPGIECQVTADVVSVQGDILIPDATCANWAILVSPNRRRAGHPVLATPRRLLSALPARRPASPRSRPVRPGSRSVPARLGCGPAGTMLSPRERPGRSGRRAEPAGGCRPAGRRSSGRAMPVGARLDAVENPEAKDVHGACGRLIRSNWLSRIGQLRIA
jgi:hypothetical protein